MIGRGARHNDWLNSARPHRATGVRADDLERARTVLQSAEERHVSLHNVAVREFALRGGPFLEPALELYREARARGAKVSKGSATKLIGACAQAGEEKAAAEVIRVAGGSLDGALDILYGLIRQPHEPHAASAE